MSVCFRATGAISEKADCRAKKEKRYLNTLDGQRWSEYSGITYSSRSRVQLDTTEIEVVTVSWENNPSKSRNKCDFIQSISFE